MRALNMYLLVLLSVILQCTRVFGGSEQARLGNRITEDVVPRTSLRVKNSLPYPISTVVLTRKHGENVQEHFLWEDVRPEQSTHPEELQRISDEPSRELWHLTIFLRDPEGDTQAFSTSPMHCTLQREDDGRELTWNIAGNTVQVSTSGGTCSGTIANHKEGGYNAFIFLDVINTFDEDDLFDVVVMKEQENQGRLHLGTVGPGQRSERWPVYYNQRSRASDTWSASYTILGVRQSFSGFHCNLDPRDIGQVVPLKIGKHGLELISHGGRCATHLQPSCVFEDTPAG